MIILITSFSVPADTLPAHHHDLHPVRVDVHAHQEQWRGLELGDLPGGQVGPGGGQGPSPHGASAVGGSCAAWVGPQPQQRQLPRREITSPKKPSPLLFVVFFVLGTLLQVIFMCFFCFFFFFFFFSGGFFFFFFFLGGGGCVYDGWICLFLFRA